MPNRLFSLILGVLLVSICHTNQAHAVLFGFGPVTNNNATNVATGISQLSVDVTSYNSSTIQFYFANSGPLASSITDIYFDDNANTIALPMSIINGSGVSFSPGASPNNLPGGNAIGFQNDAGFDSDSNTPTQPKGINPGEWLIIRLQYEGASNLNSVVAALTNQTLRIGIHVQGFSNGGSESFVSGPMPTAVVPEPATYLLLASSLMHLAIIQQKTRKNRNRGSQISD
jgi:hypothetical protein